MSMVEYTVDEHVAVITLNSGENRLRPDFINAFIEVLDAVEKDTDARALVVRSAHEKIFSNGIDLEWLVPIIQSEKMRQAKEFFYLLNTLFKRTLTSPLITVAAINGHAFAAGAIWACAFDFRFMRTGRGYFCFPEVDLGIPFLPGMLALLKRAIPTYQMEAMVLTGLRMTAEECERHHIVTQACPLENLMDEALGFAKGLKKNRVILREIKFRMYRDIIRALDEEDAPYIEAENFHIG
jgi:Delta3-Delta2-enoyl-CoA isomerase